MPLGSTGKRFNGGTITQPLAIDLTGQTDALPLSIFGASGGSNDLLKLTSGGGATALEVFQAAGKAAGVYLATSDNNSVVLYVDGEAAPSQAADVIRVVDKNGLRSLVCPASGPPRFAGGLQTTAITSGALPTVAPVSGTAFQCSTTRDVFLTVPVTYNPGVATTATCKVELSPDNVTFSELVTVTQPVGTVFDGSIEAVQLVVPAAWRVKLTVVNATLGTGTYY